MRLQIITTAATASLLLLPIAGLAQGIPPRVALAPAPGAPSGGAENSSPSPLASAGSAGAERGADSATPLIDPAEAAAGKELTPAQELAERGKSLPGWQPPPVGGSSPRGIDFLFSTPQIPVLQDVPRLGGVELQALLRHHCRGTPEGFVDGKVGPGTLAVLTAFQSSHGLETRPPADDGSLPEDTTRLLMGRASGKCVL